MLIVSGLDSIHGVQKDGIFPAGYRGMLKDLHSEMSSSSYDARKNSEPNFAFRDDRYLSAVISHLKDVRLAKSIEIERLSRRAALKRNIIRHAETRNFVPNSSQLKAWSSALGIQWEDLWSNALMLHECQVPQN